MLLKKLLLLEKIAVKYMIFTLKILNLSASLCDLSVMVFRSLSPSRPLGVTRRCAASGISASARTG